MSNYTNTNKHLFNAKHYGKEALKDLGSAGLSTIGLGLAAGQVGAGLFAGFQAFKGIAGNIVGYRAAAGFFPTKEVTDSLPFKAVDATYNFLFQHPTAAMGATEAAYMATHPTPIINAGSSIWNLAKNLGKAVYNTGNAAIEVGKAGYTFAQEVSGKNTRVDEDYLGGVGNCMKNELTTIVKIPSINLKEEGVDYSNPDVQKVVKDVETTKELFSNWVHSSPDTSEYKHTGVDIIDTADAAVTAMGEQWVDFTFSSIDV